MLQAQLPVHLIATPREGFVWCTPRERIADVVGRNTERYDHLPVKEDGSDRIIGVLDLAPFMSGVNKPRGAVRGRMEPLSEDNLIGADAGIIDFVRRVDGHGFRLLVSGSQISGLVSWSDLQRLPVRASLFALVTRLEMVMTQAIKIEFPAGEGWLERLNEKDRKMVRGRIGRNRKEDAFVDALLATDIDHKRTILASSDLFDDATRKAFWKELATLRCFRNDLAHAHDYAASRDAARRLAGSVRAIETWTSHLASLSS